MKRHDIKKLESIVQEAKRLDNLINYLSAIESQALEATARSKPFHFSIKSYDKDGKEGIGIGGDVERSANKALEEAFLNWIKEEKIKLIKALENLVFES